MVFGIFHNLITLPLLYGAVGLIPLFLSVFYRADLKADLKIIAPKQSLFLSSHYDFIVVGGGTTGSVVANRLSENFKVLLIERGGNQNPLSSIPALYYKQLGNPSVEYSYCTVPQENSCFAMNKQSSLWSRGRGLGGSSSIGGMTYLRGHPDDYNSWAKVTGDPRWSYENVLPFFKRSENFCFACDKNHGNGDVVNPDVHYKGGPLTISRPNYQPLVSEFLEGCEHLGFGRVDFSGPYLEGCSSFHQTTKYGKRQSTNTAFIQSILPRPNLTILKFSQVFKLLFEGDTNRVIGVKYERHGQINIAFAHKEVILSAGVVDTPKILQYSSIGPKVHLESLGIPVIVDSPVGKNLQDPVGTFLGPFLINQPLSFFPDRDINKFSIFEYLKNGEGPLGFSPYGSATAFFTSPIAIKKGQSGWPDTEMYMVPLSTYKNLAQDFSRIYNIQEGILEKYFHPVKGKDAFFIFVRVTRPKSRGEILLSSMNIHDDPLINPKYYTDVHNKDFAILLEGINKALHLAEHTPSFKKIGSILSPVPFPTCSHIEFRTLPYFECYLRSVTLTSHNSVGTASMGPPDGLLGVVDSELRVYGTQNLRVADSSVMPFSPSASPMAACIMIGERVSDLIKEYWLSNQIYKK